MYTHSRKDCFPSGRAAVGRRFATDECASTCWHWPAESIGDPSCWTVPSLIALVELSPCGPVRADSSVNFGVSGHVYNVDGEPLFGPHTQDQLDLWVGLGAKPAPRLFERTLACLERGREREWKNQSHDARGSGGVGGGS